MTMDTAPPGLIHAVLINRTIKEIENRTYAAERSKFFPVLTLLLTFPFSSAFSAPSDSSESSPINRGWLERDPRLNLLTFSLSHLLTFPLPRLLTSGERTFRQLPPHHGRHLKMHNLMIPNFQLHRAETVRPPELLNLFDDSIPKVSILHRSLS